jgi:UDP-GlcNAc:undecaprenyl-phosphate GlcNAc-1-phosphate transferase
VADRGHIHHRLLDRGLTPKRASLLLYGACLGLAILSLALSMAKGHYAGLIVLVFCAATLFGVSKLGYVEFDVARRVLFQRFRRVLESELHVVGFEARIAGAKTLEECWTHIVDLCDELGFSRVRLVLGSRVFTQTLRPVDPIACWSLRIPLSDRDAIEFLRPFRSEFHASTAMPFFDLARNSLRLSLARFQEQPKPRPEGVSLFAEAGAE